MLLVKRGPKITTRRGRKAGAKELRAWLSAEEHARWVAAATSSGQKLGDYVRALTPPLGSHAPGACLFDGAPAVYLGLRDFTAWGQTLRQHAYIVGTSIFYSKLAPNERMSHPNTEESS